jgi:hypothetical protein
MPTLDDRIKLEEEATKFVPIWEEKDLEEELTPIYALLPEDIKNLFRYAEENNR